ncbi:ferrochelatase [Aliiglaciecola sp. 2_MG-2023]|uniref:ferrochelatase n=1 Tax=unclassified Aliiglaciecola TaxID=2593648 RepID=UPI0026E1498C|nr:MULTISPECIES: ferrochelatase [unclassified Aliiglaciecola]MDO6712570.1 ferrochelatase [Aliiglaciecola sp. 2_MG-2023]MDO6753686.1 ferrochelatase [Aliiglaciecola sp. 1_MG-2023]
MKYTGSPNFKHNQPDKIGVLITNLGTPEAPTKKALKTYLKEFLSDPRVVEIPRLLWWMILNLVILNIRPKRSAKAYATVWEDEGSPLMIHSINQAAALKKTIQAKYGEGVIVDFAMRYGSPSISGTVEKMMQQGVRKLVVLPLYPQYSASTSASTFDAIAADFEKRRWIPDLRFISQYCDHPEYIQAVADKIRQHWQQHERADKLIFSYHGIPERYLTNGDPYFCQCHKTSRLIAENLGLQKDQFLICFQSRFGREEWLKPYTDHTLQSLPKSGVESVQIVCPGFSVDCLETIEEIGVENRDYFLEAGGKRYEYIPALNDDPAHIDMMASIIGSNLHGWDLAADNSSRANLAKAKGATI